MSRSGAVMHANFRPRASGLLGMATREARAMFRLATLLPRDLGEGAPCDVEPGDDVVVLVHGTLATAGAWRPLREKLAELPRAHAVAFTYGPTFGVHRVAAAIGERVQRLPAGARVHLVGHSLGGLAVRWFVQEGEGRLDGRVVQTVSLGAPFTGARGARLLPGPAGRDMRAGSDVLGRLAASAVASDVGHLSVFGTADTAVDPDTRFPVGERLVIPGAGHNSLLFDETVTRTVTERVRELGR